MVLGELSRGKLSSIVVRHTQEGLLDGTWIGARYVRVKLKGRDAYTFLGEVTVFGSMHNSTEAKQVPEFGAWAGAWPARDHQSILASHFEQITQKPVGMMLYYDTPRFYDANCETPGPLNLYEYNTGWKWDLGSFENMTTRNNAHVMVGWLPYCKTAEQIASGEIDDDTVAYLESMVRHRTANGYPIWFRPMNEMASDHIPTTGDLLYGGDPDWYRRAWRRLYNIAERLGAASTEYVWVWSPWANSASSDYYPGDNYVDWVGASAYAETADNLISKQIDGADWYTTYSSRKPMVFTEGGYSSRHGGTVDTKVNWIEDWFDTILTKPDIMAAVWFEDRGNRLSVTTAYRGCYDRGAIERNYQLAFRDGGQNILTPAMCIGRCRQYSLPYAAITGGDALTAEKTRFSITPPWSGLRPH